MDNKRVVGIFSTEEEAIRAIERLKASGYTKDDISVIAKQRESLDRIAMRTDTDVNDANMDKTVGGAVAGGVIGGIGALLVELGVLAIPGVGPFLAAGPIAATLAGLVAGGAVGGMIGALVDLGMSEEDAKEYETYLNRGDILVLVENDRGTSEVYDNFYENNSVIRNRYEPYRNQNTVGNDINIPPSNKY
jgi:gas vesicle protein